MRAVFGHVRSHIAIQQNAWRWVVRARETGTSVQPMSLPMHSSPGQAATLIYEATDVSESRQRKQLMRTSRCVLAQKECSSDCKNPHCHPQHMCPFVGVHGGQLVLNQDCIVGNRTVRDGPAIGTVRSGIRTAEHICAAFPAAQLDAQTILGKHICRHGLYRADLSTLDSAADRRCRAIEGESNTQDKSNDDSMSWMCAADGCKVTAKSKGKRLRRLDDCGGKIVCDKSKCRTKLRRVHQASTNPKSAPKSGPAASASGDSNKKRVATQALVASQPDASRRRLGRQPSIRDQLTKAYTLIEELQRTLKHERNRMSSLRWLHRQNTQKLRELDNEMVPKIRLPAATPKIRLQAVADHLGPTVGFATCPAQSSTSR
jgi:hypothetical protein